MKKKLLIIVVVVFLLLSAMSSEENKNNPPNSSDDSVVTNPDVVDKAKDYKEVSGRLSSTVSFIYSDDKTASWLQNPKQAFVEAWVYFEEDLSETTIFGIDMELLEGSDNPIRFEGADWMALVGLQRNGTVWVAGGSPEGLEGKPSSDRNWQFKQLGTSLSPNTWYKLRTVADYDKLEFVSFSVEGPGINKTLDLSGIQLDYPNKMNFDGRALTHYVWTIDGTAIGGSKNRSSSAYFDDIRYGIIENGQEVTLHTDNIESFKVVFDELPIKLDWGKIVLGNFEEKVWYQERDEALTRPIEKTFARSGNTVIEADAEVRDISMNEWMSE